MPKCELPEKVEVMAAVTGPWGDREKSIREKDEHRIGRVLKLRGGLESMDSPARLPFG